MTTQVQFSTFNFHNLPVRVVIDNTSEYWFCAKDVCNILGYLNDSKAIKDHCKEKGVTKRYSLTKGGEQEITFINEPNLYRLIIKSRKPEAEPFEAWVFEEVLPQIRKTGRYEQQPLALPEPEPTFTLELTAKDIHQLAWLWFGHGNMGQLLAELEAPLRALQSALAPRVHSHAFEYKRQYTNTKPIIERLLADYHIDNGNSHNLNTVLAKLREHSALPKMHHRVARLAHR